MTPVEQLYTALLGDPDLSPVVQQRIFDFGVKKKSLPLLSVLAGHPALLKRLDKALGELSYAKVKSAWASRSDRTLEEIEELAKTDTRAGVLSEIGKRTDLSEEAYKAIVKRRQLKCDWVLLSNPNVSLETKKEVARNLGGDLGSDGWQTYSKLRAILADQPELHEDLAQGSDNLRILEMCSSTPELSEGTQTNIADVIVTALLKAEKEAARLSAAGSYYYPDASYSLLVGILNNLSSNPGLSPKVASFLVSSLKSISSVQVKNCVRILKAFKSATSSGVNPLIEARTTTDLTVLESYVQTVSRTYDRALAVSVALNLCATPEMLSSIGSYVPDKSHHRIFAARGNDFAGIAAVVAQNPYYINDDLLRATNYPKEVLIAIAENCVESGRPVPGHLLFSEFLTPDIVRMLPMAALSSMGEAQPVLSKATGEIILKQCGESLSRWEVFEGLAEQYEGSFENLLEAVASLVSEDPNEVSFMDYIEEPDVENLELAEKSAAEDETIACSVKEVAAQEATIKETDVQVDEQLSLL